MLPYALTTLTTSSKGRVKPGGWDVIRFCGKFPALLMQERSVYFGFPTQWDAHGPGMAS